MGAAKRQIGLVPADFSASVALVAMFALIEAFVVPFTWLAAFGACRTWAHGHDMTNDCVLTTTTERRSAVIVHLPMPWPRHWLPGTLMQCILALLPTTIDILCDWVAREYIC